MFNSLGRAHCVLALILLSAYNVLATPDQSTFNYLAMTELSAQETNFRAVNSHGPQTPSKSSNMDKLTDNSTSITAADISAILAEIHFTDSDRNGANSSSSLNKSSKAVSKSTAMNRPLHRALDTDSNSNDARARMEARPMQSTSRVNRPSPTTMEVAKASATIEAATCEMCRSALRDGSSTQTAAQVLRKLRQIDITKIDNNDIKRAASTFSRFHKRQKFQSERDGSEQTSIAAVEENHHKRPKRSGKDDEQVEEMDFSTENGNETFSAAEVANHITQNIAVEAESEGLEPKPRLFEFFTGFFYGSEPSTTSKPPVTTRSACFPTRPQFRTADGSANNLLHTEWGRQNSLLKRLHGIGPHYDGDCKIKDPRMRAYGYDPAYRNMFVNKPSFGSRLLPNARVVSNVLMNAGPNGIDDGSITNMVMQWGQFIDHDLSLSPLYGALDGMSDLPLSESCVRNGQCLSHPECICICNTGDFGDKACLDLRRSAPGQTSLGEFREQINELTVYMDGSQIYGSSDNETLELRARFPTDMGLLKASTTSGQEMLPVEANVDAPGRSDSCQAKSTACYAAGDVRVNVHVGLASMHTLWLREHNRIARQLRTINPQWNGERIFQESRRIVGAMLQRITYGNWLPIVLGETVMNAFGLTVRDDSSQYQCSSYHSGVEAATLNEFTTAAFRFGHSLVGNHLRRRGIDDIRLSDTYFDMSVMQNQPQTCNAVLGGLSDRSAQNVDNLIGNVVRNELFKIDGFSGHDLPARSIQRGRDHGQPGYAFFAWACQQRYGGLGSTFYPNLRTRLDPNTEAFKIGQIALGELPLRPTAAQLLLQAGYAGLSVADMDLFPAGISEIPVRELAQGGGLVGPTFACIIAEQFRQLKHGDRFFYTNPAVDGNGQANPQCSGANAFTPCQLRAISRQSLAHVMCANGAVSNGQIIQRDVFKRASTANPNVNCGMLQPLDLNLWRDGALCNEATSCL